MTIDEILDEVERLDQEGTPKPWSVDPISHVYVRHGERGECGPAGLEPATYGLEGRGKLRAAQGDSPGRVPDVSPLPDFALRVLQAAALGEVQVADLEALAHAVLQEERPRLALQVLVGGEHTISAAIRLAGLVLRASNPNQIKESA